MFEAVATKTGGVNFSPPERALSGMSLPWASRGE